MHVVAPTEPRTQARELLGLGPVYVKLVGSFAELAVLNMVGVWGSFAGGGWVVRGGGVSGG
jgi:hypothetical protein